jgi:hypothetical protein
MWRAWTRVGRAVAAAQGSLPDLGRGLSRLYAVTARKFGGPGSPRGQLRQGVMAWRGACLPQWHAWAALAHHSGSKGVGATLADWAPPPLQGWLQEAAGRFDLVWCRRRGGARQGQAQSRLGPPAGSSHSMKGPAVAVGGWREESMQQAGGLKGAGRKTDSQAVVRCSCGRGGAAAFGACHAQAASTKHLACERARGGRRRRRGSRTGSHRRARAWRRGRAPTKAAVAPETIARSIRGRCTPAASERVGLHHARFRRDEWAGARARARACAG